MTVFAAMLSLPMSSVGMCMISISLLSICSLIQKYWASMCFVLMEVLLPFSHRIMVDLLSWNNCIGGSRDGRVPWGFCSHGWLNY